MPKENRATNIEKQKRIQAVYDIILQGGSTKDIYEFSEKNWDISKRQADNYIAECYEIIKKSIEDKGDVLFAKHIAKRELLYRNSYSIQDFKTCLIILKDIATLQQLYKVIIESKHEETITYNVELSQTERSTSTSNRILEHLEAEPSDN